MSDYDGDDNNRSLDDFLEEILGDDAYTNVDAYRLDVAVDRLLDMCRGACAIDMEEVGRILKQYPAAAKGRSDTGERHPLHVLSQQCLSDTSIATSMARRRPHVAMGG